MAGSPKHSIGIKQLSSELDISVGTISRALNGQPGVKDQTRQRVLDAAHKLGYVPDMQAKGFRTRRTHQIGVIVPSLRDITFLEKIRSVQETTWERGYQVGFAASEWDVEREAAICRDMLSRGVDGLIMLTPASPTRWQHFVQFADRDKPVLLVKTHSHEPSQTVRALQSRFSTLEVEFADCFAEALEHLIALGHRRIGLFGYGADQHNRRLSRPLPRLDAPPFDAADVLQIPIEGDTIEAGYRAMASYFDRTDAAERPTAFQTLNDNLAIGAMRALADAGLNIPHDVSLIGFNDNEAARYTVPRLSTISQTYLNLGRRAAELMLGLIEGQIEDRVHERVQTKLILRESTAPPARQDIHEHNTTEGGPN